LEKGRLAESKIMQYGVFLDECLIKN